MPALRLSLHAQRLLRLALPLAAAACLAPPALAAFGFDDVAQRARELAFAPYKKPDAPLPKELSSLNYDQYRDIRFRPERSLWRADKLPFEAAFFHRGGIFLDPVRMNEITENGPREIPFRADRFDYGKNAIDPAKVGDAGYAGFRIHFNVNGPKYKDEVLSVVGASYFRALGKDQRYGLSARGLAIDTGLASGEEFPRFTEFWLERPAPDARELRFYALLDSKSVTGAYRFVLKPGVDTVMTVKARIHARRNIAKLGIAPLTSMYLFGENQHKTVEDYRPEVHDSDGLSIQSGTGEWIWRPLVNPQKLLMTSFGLSNPQGFGLQQRDRTFSSYEDLEARYDMRPGAFVKPLKPFGPGRVELVQIPSPFETTDNIVAYWIPRDPPQAGKSIEVEYQILWQRETPTRPPTSWVTQTRRGPGYQANRDEAVYFHIDFEGPSLKKMTEKTRLEAPFSTDANGEIAEKIVQRNPLTSGVRVSIKVRRVDPTKPVELRGYLRDEHETLSETWAYILPPD